MNAVPMLDEAALPALLARFYDKVRRDSDLGPLFDDAVHDWPGHLDRLGEFWSSVMLASGRYKGNPVAVHLPHARRITPEMFERWLALWAETTSEMLPGAVAAAMQARARRIAETLQAALRAHAAHQDHPLGEPASFGRIVSAH